jgi:2'-5' RNA ligase
MEAPSPPPEVLRLFFAVEVPQGLNSELLALQRRAPDLQIPTAFRNLHVTLRFLGDTPYASVQPIVDAVKEELTKGGEGLPPFQLTLTGLSAFRKGPATTVILSLEESPGLVGLKGLVDQALKRFPEIPPTSKGPFRPHVTLARIRKPLSPKMEKLLGPQGPRLDLGFEVGEFSLYRSVLGPGGAAHFKVETFYLSR